MRHASPLILVLPLALGSCEWPSSRRSEERVMFHFDGVDTQKYAQPKEEDPWHVDPSGLPNRPETPPDSLETTTYKVPERQVLYYYTPFSGAYEATHFGPYGPEHTVGTFYEETVERSPYFLVERREAKLPRGGAPLNFEVEKSRAVVSPEGEAVSVRVRVVVPSAAQAQTTPMNLCVVLDLSRSADDPEKLMVIKQVAHHLVDQIFPGDRFGMVVIGDGVRLLVRPDEEFDRQFVHDTIESLVPAGGAGLVDGLLEAYVRVAQGLDVSGYAGHVIIVSDGLAGRGGTDPWRVAELARRELGTRGIQTSAVAAGQLADPEFLSLVSREGEGRFGYVRQPKEVSQILGSHLRSLFKVAARNVWLQIKPAEGIEVVSVHSAALRAPLAQVRELGLGNLAEGEERSFLFRLRLPAVTPPSRFEVSFRLYYEQLAPERKTHRERKAHFLVAATNKKEPQNAVSEIEAYERLVLGLDQIRRALESHEDTTAKTAIDLLEGDFSKLKAIALESGDADLVRQAQAFEHFANRLKVVVDHGRLQGASIERENLRRDFFYRRHADPVPRS